MAKSNQSAANSAVHAADFLLAVGHRVVEHQGEAESGGEEPDAFGHPARAERARRDDDHRAEHEEEQPREADEARERRPLDEHRGGRRLDRRHNRDRRARCELVLSAVNWVRESCWCS